MAYEPKSQEAKDAIAAGADPAVVEEMENKGEFTPKTGDEKEKEPEHVETAEEKIEREKAEGDANEAKGLNRDGSAKKPPEDEEHPGRTATHMPVWKHKEETKKAVDAAVAEAKTQFEAELAKMAGKGAGNSAEDISKFAEEFNLTPEVAGSMIDRMVGLIETRAGLPEIRKNIEAGTEAAKAAAEEQGFVKEFEEKSTQDAITAAANGQEVTPEIRKKVKELAYTTTYAKYRLADIIRLEAGTLFPEAPKESVSAERGRGGAGRGAAAVSITEMTPEQINNLSDEDFRKLSTELGGSGSRFTKITKAK